MLQISVPSPGEPMSIYAQNLDIERSSSHPGSVHLTHSMSSSSVGQTTAYCLAVIRCKEELWLASAILKCLLDKKYKQTHMKNRKKIILSQIEKFMSGLYC